MATKQCEICQEDFTIRPSHFDKRRTCSRKCGALLKSKEIRGKNHPNYGKPGYSRLNAEEIRSKYKHKVKHINKYQCGHSKKHFGVREIECVECGDWFERPSCWSKDAKLCSNKCSKNYISKNYSNENSVNFKHGEMVVGYKRINIGKKRVLEHRHLMEEKIGRKLLQNEVVHHINEDKLDNRVDNLMIMTNSEHTKLHAQLRRLK